LVTTVVTSEWGSCKNSLKSVFSEDIYIKWIEPLEQLESNETTLTLQCPSTLNLDHLSKVYLGIIVHSFFQITGRNVQIRFRISNPRAKTHRPKVPFSSVPSMDLNQNYSFSNFVVGSNSQFAFSATKAVAENTNEIQFNPLLIYGGVGLGKTHLLQAIGNHILNDDHNKRVRYITAETFYREFVDSIQHNRITELSNYYRQDVDLLLMDDVQFLSGKDRTQEEFFHIFNALHQMRKQIILTSDNPPNQLQGLEDRLVSRFQWGLIVDIQPPDIETREAILKKKAEDNNLDISHEIISFLAESIDDNVRVLEGAIRQLLLQASLKQEDISMELAKEIVKGASANRKTKLVSSEDITNMVSQYFSVEVKNILDRGRGTKEVAQARQVAMFLMKELTSSSLKTIGNRFGGRDHSTVVHAIKTIEKCMTKDELFKTSIDSILNKLSLR